jgi:hypothetical protein
VTSRADREWLVARYRRVGAEQRRRAHAPAARPVPASRAALAALSTNRE